MIVTKINITEKSGENKKGFGVVIDSPRLTKRVQRVVERGPDGKKHIMKRVLTYDEAGNLVHPPDTANNGQGYINVDEVRPDEKYESLMDLLGWDYLRENGTVESLIEVL